MRKLKSLLFVVAMAFVLVSCQDDAVPEEPAIDQDVTEIEQDSTQIGQNYNEPEMKYSTHAAKSIILSDRQKSINAGVQSFSWDLFSEISEQYWAEENLVFSPFSLQVELAMLLNAADDKTLQETLAATHLSEYSVAELNQFFSDFAVGIAEADDGTRFCSSNSLWYDLRYSVVPQFSQTLNDYYACEFFPVVYGAETTDKINRWAEDRTYGRIKRVIEYTVHDIDFIHLMNAVYFRSPWSDCMDDKGNKNFTSINGAVSSVEMMQGRCYSYLSNSLYTATMVPFSNGAFGMFFILPNDGVTFGEISDHINAAKINFANIPSSSKVIVTLPKFNTESDIQLSAVLDNLGCGNILNTGAGILSDFHSQKFGLKQIANISIDVDGAEAAAVTSVMCGSTGEPEPEPKYITFDRPFIYGIIECSTGMPLFLGQIVKL